MDRQVLQLLAPLAALCAAALSQALYYRLRPQLSTSYLAALAGGLACLTGITRWLGGLPGVEAANRADDIAIALANLGAFLGLWLCFVAVVGLSVSIRLRIMSFLKAAGRPLAEDEIEARFEGNMLVRRRLDRLISGGHVREEGGRLCSGGTWLTRVARFNALVKRFLTGSASEFR